MRARPLPLRFFARDPLDVAPELLNTLIAHDRRVGRIVEVEAYRGTDDAKEGLFQHLDYLASNWLLPVGGFFITIAVGWFMTRKSTRDELDSEDNPGWFHYEIWRFIIRYVSPVAVALIIIAVIRGKDFS